MTRYRADGTAARGMVLISWPAFTTADGKAVAAGSLSVQLGNGGAFAASLAPNTGAQPAGVYYKVVFQLAGQEPSTEYWVVPATGSTSIGAVRAKLMPATAAAQVLTRDVADTNYVHVSDDQTVNGVKTFSNSPSVPTPQNAGDAANKGYVDSTAADVNLASPAPIGSVTPNTGTFTSVNNVLNAATFPGPDIGAKVNAAAATCAGITTQCKIQIPSSTQQSFSTGIVFVANETVECVASGRVDNVTTANQQLRYTGPGTAFTMSQDGGRLKGCNVALGPGAIEGVKIGGYSNLVDDVGLYGGGTSTILFHVSGTSAEDNHVQNSRCSSFTGVCTQVDHANDTYIDSITHYGTVGNTTGIDLVLDSNAGGVSIHQYKGGNSGLHGLVIRNTLGGLPPTWLFIDDLETDVSSGDGWLFDSTLAGANIGGYIHNSWVAGSGGHGVNNQGAAFFSVSEGNKIRNNAKSGINDSCAGHAVDYSNNFILGNNQSNAGYSGIDFSAHPGGRTVVGNTIGNYPEVGGFQQYAIASSSDVEGLVVSDNNCDHNVAGCYNLSSVTAAKLTVGPNMSTATTVPAQFVPGAIKVNGLSTLSDATVQNLTVNGTCTGCGTGTVNLASPPAIGNVSPNTGTFSVLDGIPNAAAFAGTDACAKINAAVGSLPATGGAVDARGFQGAATCAATLLLDRPVHIHLGAVQLTLQGNPGISVTSYEPVVVEGDGWEYNYTPGSGKGTVLISGSAAPLIVDNSSQGSQFHNLELFGNGLGTFAYFGLANGTVFDGVHAHGFQYTGIFAPGGMVHFRGHTMINANGGDGLVGGGDIDIEGEQQVSHNSGNGVHVFSGSVRYNQPAIDNSGLHGLYFDGRAAPDWTANANFVSPTLIKPVNGNPGGYYFYSYNVNGTTGSTAPAWPQSVGGTVNDGSTKWINVSTFNNGTAPHIGVANQLLISGGYIGNNGVGGIVGFISDNVRLEGASSTNHTCGWNTISGLYVTEASTTTATVTGVHLLNCDYTTVSNLVWLGSGWNASSLPADQGGLVAENANFNSISNYNAVWSTRSAVKLINASGTQLDNIQSGGTGTNTTEAPNNYAVQIDANSGPTQINDLTVDIWHNNEKGVYNRGALTSIDNYQVHPSSYGATLDDLQYATLTNAHGRQPNVPVEFDIAGSPALAINSSGGTVVSGDLSVRDIPGHAYFVSQYGSIQTAINAAYGSGVVSGKVIDDRTAAYSGAGFYVPDSVTVELAPVPYTFTSTVTHNNGNNNVTAAIVVEQGAHLKGSSTSSNHGTTIGVSPGFAGDIIATTSEGTGIGSTAQWWHWGSIENLNINGTGQASGRCLVVENMGETARVENIEARSCYGNNMEIIGASATQSSIRNITTMRSQTASGIRFTNLAGVGKIDGLSGDCNPTALVSVQENAAGSLTILGLKAEGEASICTGTAQDPVVLLDGLAGFNDHVRIIGGYAFGTAQANFAKFINAGNAILETEGLYITGYTNMLNDTVRAVTVPLTASSSKQPFYYEPGGTTYANQAFTLTGGTFLQGSPAGTATEIFGLTTGSATLLAAAGNGDNGSVLTGGIQISGQNRTSYGTPPEIMARWGYRWLGAGLGYDTTNFDLVPAWNAGDSSTRNLGNPLTVCQKGSTTVSCRWPNVFAQNVDTNSLTVNGSALTIPTGGLTTPSMDGISAVGSSANFARADHVHPSDTTRVATTTTVNGHALTGNVTVTAADVGAPHSVSIQGPTSAVTGTGAMTALYSITIPAGTFSVGTGIKCVARSRHTTGSASVSMGWKLGGTTYTYPTTYTTGSTGGDASIEIFTFSSLTAETVNIPWASFGGTTESPYTGLAWSENVSSGTTLQFLFNVGSSDKLTGDSFYCSTVQ